MGIGEIAAIIAGVIVLYFICRMLLLPFRLTMKLVYNGVFWSDVFITVPITVITALIAGFTEFAGCSRRLYLVRLFKPLRSEQGTDVLMRCCVSAYPSPLL